ncbi:MAG: GNAT family N-acetyltransferase [candidate division Zixibacteria bacterium]|nr:GNAT family N-acetyltransferase [candidate division Zixibacteria bacterium]
MENKIVEKEMSWFEKAKKIYQDKGIFALLVAGWGKLFKSIFDANSAIWFERELSQPIQKCEAKTPLNFVSDSPQEMIAWLKSSGQEGLIHPKEIETGIEEKHYFPYVEKKDGIIAGGAKVGYNRVYIVDYGRIVDFPEGMAFWYDTYVPVAMRGLGIATYLIISSLVFLKEKGYRKVLCHIPKWNKASIKAFERCGFKKIGYVRFLKVFGFKFTLPNLSKIIK